MTFFIVTGRPRSMSAWVATALTWGDVACLHEPPRFSVADVRRVAEEVPARCVGVVDTSLLASADQLARLWPDARLVLLQSDGVRWRQWCRRWRLSRELAARVDLSYERTLRSWSSLGDRVLMVPEGQAVARIGEIWTHVGGAPAALPAWRTEMLSRLRVELMATPDTLRSQLARLGLA